MNKYLTLLIFTLSTVSTSYCQVDSLSEKFDMPTALEETSGFIFFNDKLITHNDSGGNANLYELDTITGLVSRTISISNAINQDWEDITQDDNSIYIGAFGNNNGNRTDLKIYKIDKNNYVNNTSVTADIISFNYQDQSDFTTNNQTNFDAEAMIIYNNNIIIFTKNWGDLQTNAYIISTTAGSHTAIKIGTYDIQGLITGATFNSLDSSIFLTGYDTSLFPFLLYLGNFTGNLFFDGTVVKTDLTSSIGQGSQIEAITNLNNERYFFSREKLYTFISKVYTFNSLYVLDIDDITQEVISIFPNPISNRLKINSEIEIEKINIYNSLGKLIFTQNDNFDSIILDKFTSGNYFIKILLENKKEIKKKLIKL